MTLEQFLEYLKQNDQVEVCWLNTQKKSFTDDQSKVNLPTYLMHSIPKEILKKDINEFRFGKDSLDGKLIIYEFHK
ncbi:MULTISPECIES: hypothetical protein [unclassified Breznakia]|uniref:hypothetical protein n=1 Tax=unclassified Breznakia TaxID=2623764 RepID=UPI0024772324|nr:MULTISPECIES: hypothetical protein [unclassified Breznakia]MDH6367854.1 hypothetical protein [Breznakia sp. PH1-1]MDH6404942.1 hypothetical protein [Breznakia sp. PF1-11]MDH6412657.1 hypothetical protein [Breznakia sp. PFB1-11]MDH6415040.1 hypothetical protein [Breznakia sp. PFB1-14]MDH6417328.1 hypothetical protein [Breznakia sp. PFB1-4]